jgi:hypothetical protein
MPSKVTMFKIFDGVKYPLDQIYWDKQRALSEAKEARAHGFYSRVVAVIYDGELKYARYSRPFEYVRKPLRAIAARS